MPYLCKSEFGTRIEVLVQFAAKLLQLLTLCTSLQHPVWQRKCRQDIKLYYLMSSNAVAAVHDTTIAYMLLPPSRAALQVRRTC